MPLAASQVKQRLAELLEIPKKEADDILWALEQVAIETVKNADSLTLPGIGKLDSKVQAERTARNPRTGEKVQVPAKVTVKFRVATSLKNQAPSLNSKKGKALLEQVEQNNKAKAKRKKQREAEAAEENGKSKKVKGKKAGRPKAASGRKKSRF